MKLSKTSLPIALGDHTHLGTSDYSRVPSRQQPAHHKKDTCGGEKCLGICAELHQRTHCLGIEPCLFSGKAGVSDYTAAF